MREDSITHTAIHKMMRWLDKMPSLSFLEIPGKQLFLNRQAIKRLELPDRPIQVEEWLDWMQRKDQERRQNCQRELKEKRQLSTDFPKKLTYSLYLPSRRKLRIREEIILQQIDGIDFFVSTAFLLQDEVVPVSPEDINLSSLLDVSETQKTQKQLQKSSQLIKGIFDTSSAAIEALEAIRDGQGKIVDFVYTHSNKKSQEIQRLVGRKHQPGTTLLRLYPQILHNGLLDKLIRVVESGQSIQMEVPFQARSEIRWFLSEYSSFGENGLILTYVDITRLKNAEDKLKGSLQEINVSHTNLVRMVDSTDDQICSVNTNMQFISFNKSFQEEFKQNFGTDIRPGMKMEDATRKNPQLGQRLQQIWQEAFRGKMQQEVIGFGKAEKNDYRVTFHEIYGPHKKLIGLTSIGINLSRQKKIEKALKDAREFLLLSENLPNVVFTLNREGDLEYLNDAFFRFTGLPKQNYRSTELKKLVHPDDFTRLFALNTEKILKRVKVDTELKFRLQHNSGEYRWVLFRLLPILDERRNLQNWLGSLTDIHEEIINEETQRKAAEEFRQIAEGLPQLVWVTDPSGRATYFNQRWYEYTGTPVDENLDDKWLNRIHPDDRATTITEWNEALKLNKSYRVEYRIRNHEGAYRWFLGRGTPLLSEEGKVEKWFGTCTDIHDQKNQQRQLEKQNLKLNQVNEYLENYVNALAHNLRAPIANVQSLLNMVKEEKDELFRDKVFENLRKSADQLDHTVIGLVRLIEAQHQQESNLRVVDIQSCFEQVKEKLCEQLEKVQPKLSVNLRFTKINFVERYLSYALENLLSNAIKFRQENRRLEIVFESWREDKFIVLAFSDNGEGIDLDKHRQNIFKPFFRSDKKLKGSGISLHLIQHLFQREGGRVEVDSEPGRGAEFRLYIPDEI